METLKGLLGEEKKSDEEDPWRQVQDCECLPSMSWEDRLWGFGICFGIGCLLSIMSSFMVPAIFTGHPAKFALPFTLGSICSLMSTSFLKVCAIFCILLSFAVYLSLEYATSRCR